MKKHGLYLLACVAILLLLASCAVTHGEVKADLGQEFGVEVLGAPVVREGRQREGHQTNGQGNSTHRVILQLGAEARPATTGLGRSWRQLVRASRRRSCE